MVDESIAYVENIIAYIHSSKTPTDGEMVVAQRLTTIRALLLELKEIKNDLLTSKREETSSSEQNSNS